MAEEEAVMSEEWNKSKEHQEILDELKQEILIQPIVA